MQRMTSTFDWSKPQRQPLAALGIVFLRSFLEILKRFWPLLVVMLLGNKKGSDRYEWIGLVILALSVISALFRYLYFRFHLEEDKLVIRSGWIRKETKVIPLDRIQTVNIEQGPLHQLLSIVKLSIDTAGSQQEEAKIEALGRAMAEALKERLLSHRSAGTVEEKPGYHPSTLR